MSKVHKPLVLRGARQVGKTTLINQFSTEFDNYLYLNLDRKRDCKLFMEDDIPMLIDKIHIHCQKRKSDGSTLLFIDEIQNSPKAVLLLRYFKEECTISNERYYFSQCLILQNNIILFRWKLSTFAHELWQRESIHI